MAKVEEINQLKLKSDKIEAEATQVKT